MIRYTDLDASELCERDDEPQIYVNLPNVDEHRADADASNNHLHMTVHRSLLCSAVVHRLAEGPVFGPAPCVLRHEDDKE